METCACPGCDQPGTHKCSACKTKFYCGPKCQTADWPLHKEECPGLLRKVGMANLSKAQGFHTAQNWPQTLRYSDLAITKLKQLKDCPVEIIDQALNCKFDALNMMGRYREALECAKEWYCLYLTKHTHPPAILAGFALIESCIKNKEYFDAVHYAHTSWETITLSRDSHITDNQREIFIAEGAYHLAKAIKCLARDGGIPSEEMQEAGREAITLARQALEIHSQQCGPESHQVADDMGLLAQVLETFNDVDDDEAIRLYEQAKDIFVRVQGSLSANVAVCEMYLGHAYYNRAKRAHSAYDLDRELANLELALSRFREAARIDRAINRVERADKATQAVVDVEKQLLQVKILIAIAATIG